MTGEGTRLTAAIVAAVFAAALLVACGGSDSDSTSTESAATNAPASPGTAPKGSDRSSGDKGEAKDPQKDAGSQDENQGGSAGSGSVAVATPLRVSGGGSQQFRVKGGDNSIQEYGSERDESELQAAAEVVHDFYVARAEEDWGSACSYLTKSIVEQLEQLISQSPELRGKGCAVALHTFTRPLPASVRRETTVVDAHSLRQEGDQAFLIYYGAKKIGYAMPLNEEGGKLKVGALSGNPFQ